MEDRSASSKNETMNIVGAGVAGGGLGTIIAAIANGLSPDSPCKPVLTVSAPLIAICLSGLWLFLKKAYLDPYLQRRFINVLDEMLADARARSEIALSRNPSEEHKQRILKELEETELIVFQRTRQYCSVDPFGRPKIK